jgi:hypothetical protein
METRCQGNPRPPVSMKIVTAAITSAATVRPRENASDGGGGEANVLLDFQRCVL